MPVIIENFKDKRQNYGGKGNNLKILMSLFEKDRNVLIPETLILPSSFKTATVMLTDVAVSIVPINTQRKKFGVPQPSLPKKNMAIIVPIINGINTPLVAIIVALKPDFTRDLRFVPRPAENIIRITPISAMYEIN